MVKAATTKSKTPAVMRAFMDDPELNQQAITLQAGEFLFTPGQPAKHPFLIQSGLIRLGEPVEAKRRMPRTIAWLGPGKIVAWNGLVRGDAPRLWARAERETRLIPLPVRMLARRIARHPRIALEIIAQLANQLLMAQLETGELIRLETPQRLSRALCRLALNPGLTQVEGQRAVIRLTHADLASRTGISRETVSLILSRWRRQGVVKTGRGRLVVELNRLEEVAG